MFQGIFEIVLHKTNPLCFSKYVSSCFGKNQSLNGGDSASSYRHWRNGVPHTRERGKMGGGREASGNGRFPPAAYLLPLGLIRQRATFRRERSERAESPPENHENTPTVATEKALAKLEKTTLARFLARSGGNFAALK